MNNTNVIHHQNLEKGKYSATVNKMALVSADLLSFLFSLFIVTLLFKTTGEDTPLLEQLDMVRLTVLLFIAASSILWFWGKRRHYTYRKPFWSELYEVYQSLCVFALVDYVILSLLNHTFSNLEWLVLWTVVFVSIPLLRFAIKLVLIKQGVWQMPSVVIGCAENAEEAYHAINSEKLMGFDVKAFVAADEQALSSPIKGIPYIRSESYLNSGALNYKVFIALEYDQRDLRDNWIRTLSARGVRNISVIPSTRGVPLYGTDISHFFSHEVMMLRINNNLVRKSSRFVKRSFDIVVSSLLLLMLSPLFAYIGWKVSRDGGSPTYGHERVGFGGKKFKCLKFRSMVMNSQEVLQELLENDPEARAEWDKDFKLKNDPRITPIGHFLRKTSLDELPQLWNVLKGEMSLVGPRPIIDEELLRYKDDSEYYLMAKPGMSGLWQVSGRNDIDYDTRVYLDSWYVKNWSLWNDIAILFKTVGVVLNRDGAY
ncbi:undecaprenyl-phosphate galactose phosphotransferase WbaP [Photobacterium rosenbergii]|uniref:Undecaprenyl-phosphate galactose phosphotransferase WbaP n=1 Tax=Photobacterium rosenbergii TaxID=294936 RepID=A0ABU3ZPT0_9GAMM|nr:undecaprenyl-phosphate galactose phosphotransferase WbaP [Photobacterium rosenbergii]MDV5172126.1 undecaprenyl-phosphate galactose phosphotransferase WbaP [Photobacterium rosenbergii]